MLALTVHPSPFIMATNVMSGKNGPMTLSPDLAHLHDIAGLKALFESDHLYQDAKVHALWAEMFASGVVYGMKRASPRDTLDEMVDIDYEAHARYEMASRLEYQGMKHGYSDECLRERSKGFRIIRKQVRIDRVNNLKIAEDNRLQLVLLTDDDHLRAQQLESGGLADTTDEEDDF